MTNATASPARVSPSFDFKIFAAFFAIYVLWGSTFLAIRIAVLLIPPWFAAGSRFFTAGILLYAFTRLRGTPSPTAIQWRSLASLGAIMFSVTYGALFWSEQFVPSGVTSVLEATIPLFTVLFEVFILRQQAFRWRPVFGVALGFCGVALMLLRTGSAAATFPVLPCLLILGGSASWALGSVLNRSLPLPASRPITAACQMMVGGAVLLILSAATGELHPFPHIPLKAALALLYLIIAGSLIAFTAFVWLLGHMSAGRVATHAFVNPVVALALGHFLVAEAVTPRTLIGAALVIASVFLALGREESTPAKPVGVS